MPFVETALNVGANLLVSKAVDAAVDVGATVVAATVPVVGPVVAAGMVGARNVYKVGKAIDAYDKVTQSLYDKSYERLLEQGFSPEEAIQTVYSL